MPKSELVRISDRSLWFGSNSCLNAIMYVRNANNFVWLSDENLCLKAERLCSNIQISDILPSLTLECRNSKKYVVIQMSEIRTRSARTIDRLAFGIVQLSDVRISAFHCLNKSYSVVKK